MGNDPKSKPRTEPERRPGAGAVAARGASADGAASSRRGEAPSVEEAEPSQAPSRNRAILFTAFEPSGDAHAAPVIAALRRRDAKAVIFAWGGPKMEAAGATLVERTAEDGAMGLGGIAKAASVRREIQRIKRWSSQHRVVVHVPVDSPAANFPICALLKPNGVRVAHLVAPQLWAWGGWRIHKLRRLTDVVMCLLPFEEQWFRSRQVPARFIGHPVINRELDTAGIHERQKTLPHGSPRVLLLPGSRSGEVKANLTLLARSFVELADRHRGMAGLIVAANDALARLMRSIIPDMPVGLHLIVHSNPSDLDAAIHWCDLALTVSGTVTLDLARQQRPMVGVYRTGTVSWLGSKVMLRTRHRLLPNIIAGREIVPEFVPYPSWRGPSPLVTAASDFLRDSKVMAIAAEELRRVVLRFHGHDPAEEAAELILRLLDGRAIDDPKEMPPPTVDPVLEETSARTAG